MTKLFYVLHDKLEESWDKRDKLLYKDNYLLMEYNVRGNIQVTYHALRYLNSKGNVINQEIKYDSSNKNVIEISKPVETLSARFFPSSWTLVKETPESLLNLINKEILKTSI